MVEQKVPYLTCSATWLPARLLCWIVLLKLSNPGRRQERQASRTELAVKPKSSPIVAAAS